MVLETGLLAKQAHGAVTLRLGNTTILATVVAAKEPNLESDFFPLTVNYNEKYYAGGKIPGGFLKREGFEWCEGTVYVSKKPLESYEVTKIVRDLVKRYPWLNKCMRDCRQANIGRQHSLNYIFSKNAKVPTREELNASKDPHSAKKRSTGLKKKTPDQMKLHNFFEMNVMER